jgi:glutamine synthetase
VTWEAQPLGQMLITSDGTEKPIEFEPREVLAQVLDRLARKGIHPVVAFELEFYLFDKKLRDGLPQFPRDDLTDDADDQPNMHIERLSRFAPVLDEMVEATRAQGIDATVITAELGPGQFEINFGHLDDGLRAADWAALFCRSTRGVALKHGYRASFMAKPYLQHPGSGMHVHVSLYDAEATTCWPPTSSNPCAMPWPVAWNCCRTACRSSRRTRTPIAAWAARPTWPPMRAGALKTAMRACAFRSRTRKTCASNIAWPVPMPTLIWCWRRFW